MVTFYCTNTESEGVFMPTQRTDNDDHISTAETQKVLIQAAKVELSEPRNDTSGAISECNH